MATPDHYKYAETVEDTFPTPGGHQGQEVLWEYGILGGQVSGPGIGNGTTIGCCVWMTLRVVNVANTNKWQFLFDWNNTGNWTYIGPSGGGDIGWSRAEPHGETGRRPNNDLTDAYDHHVQLMYASRNCGCSWQAWSYNNLDSTITGPDGPLSTYHWEYVSNNDYLIRHN